MSISQSTFLRLSDVILKALELSLDQKDIIIADTLARALELSLTRNAGGPDFIERRTVSPEIQAAFTRLNNLRKETE